MNGRIYDPTLGRFLQADPFIQAPKNSQNYNRYSYVLNNPMSIVDPSGFIFKWLGKKIKKYWKPILAVVAAVVTYGAASGWAAGWGLTTTTTLAQSVTLYGSTVTFTATSLSVGGYMAAGAIAGAVSGAIMTGSLKGAVVGAFSGAMFAGIGGHYGDTWNMSRVGANTVAGGISSKAAGGNFANGARLSFALSMVRMGWEHTKSQTNALKIKACNSGSELSCKSNKWGELLTDGGRDTDYDTLGYGKQKGNLITNGGMALEGTGDHYYNEDSYLGRYVNKVSKTHDWMNSNLSKSIGFHGYNADTGFWLSGSEAYNTAFQIYSFGGMLPASIYTNAALMAPYPVDAFRELNE